jgi:hypothetical protein
VNACAFYSVVHGCSVVSAQCHLLAYGLAVRECGCYLLPWDTAIECHASGWRIAACKVLQHWAMECAILYTPFGTCSVDGRPCGLNKSPVIVWGSAVQCSAATRHGSVVPSDLVYKCNTYCTLFLGSESSAARNIGAI